jgi:hypothetical protein
MRIVTIQVSDEDYRLMLRHIAHQAAGRPLVAVVGIIDADPDPTDDRVLSTHAVGEIYDELDNDEDDEDGQDEDDGERTECGGCGESWNVDESDAEDVDAYCSADCERRDKSALSSRIGGAR